MVCCVFCFLFSILCFSLMYTTSFFLSFLPHKKKQQSVPPSVKAVNHVVGAPVESHVLLECTVEVFPKPLNGWYRNDGKKTSKTLCRLIFHSFSLSPSLCLILCLSIAKFVLLFLFWPIVVIFFLGNCVLYLTPCIKYVCRRASFFPSLLSFLLSACIDCYF